MSFKDLIHGNQKKAQRQKSQEDHTSAGLTPEQLQELAMEMSWGYGMLPPCGFPEGIWHLY